MMKRIISLALTFCMMQSFCLALPMGIGVEQIKEEALVETQDYQSAHLQADTAADVPTVKLFGFESGSIPTNAGFETIAVEDGLLKGSCTGVDPNITFHNVNIKSGEYSEVRVRIKHEASADFKMHLFYALYDSATQKTDWYSKYEELKVPNASTNGEFVVYTIPLTNSKIGDKTLSAFRFDPVNVAASNIEIDYIMFVPASKTDGALWSFDNNGDFEGWSPNNPSSSSVSGGALSFTHTGTYADPNFGKSVYFNGNDYKGVEVTMKYDFTESGETSTYAQVYFEAVTPDGEALTLHEVYSAKTAVTTSKSDEYVSLFIDTSSVNGWKGNNITYLRVDPINKLGSFSIDSIRLVPTDEMSWGFNQDGNYEGWTLDTSKKYSVSGGSLNFEASDVYEDPQIYMQNLNLNGSKYSAMEVRMKHDITVSGAASTFMQIYYTGTTADGTAMTLGETYISKAAVSAVKSEDYVTYTINLESAPGWYGGTINSIRFDPLNQQGDFSIDSMRLVSSEEKEYIWDFDGQAGDWRLVPEGKYSYKGSAICYTSDVYDNARFEMSGLNLDANKVTGIELVMKHTNATKATTRFYFTGVDVDGNTLSLGEDNATGIDLPASIGDDNFSYYKIDFSSCKTWKNSTIETIRIDPIKNVVGSFEIEYMRLIPAPKAEEIPLDKSQMSLSYVFDEQAGQGSNGTITVSFGDQSPESAKYVRLSWANGNSTEGYTALEDYTLLASLNGTDASEGYKITRGSLIPDGATALIACIKDCEKEFELYFDIPASKQWNVGEPLYTAAFTSDYHLGGHGSTLTAPAQKHLTVRNALDQMADYVAVVGDITQWYGEIAKSGEWQVAKDYFTGFNIPVYVTNGNHDVPDSPDARPETTHSAQFYRDFLENQIEFSKQNGLYDVTLPSNTENYYHTYANGNHLVFLSNPRQYSYSFGQEQLDWLEKILFENENSGQPIFVFGHTPSKNTVGETSHWSANQIGDNERFTSILNRHPSAIYVTGHTHLTFDNDFPSAIDGKGVNPSYINDGGIANVNYVDGTGEWVESESSMGVIAQVYSDKVLVRGRDLINNKWIGGGLYQVTFASEYSLEKPVAAKVYTTEGIKLYVENADDNVVYTWYVEGNEAVSASELTVATDFAGYVALRATANDSSYSSVLYNSVSEIVSAPVSNNKVEMRIQTPSGIRFAATVNGEARRYDTSIEYGYIVARQDKLEQAGLENTELKFGIDASLYTFGKSFVKSKGQQASTDKIWNSDLENDIYTFTGVMVNIPAKYSQIKLVARPYYKLNADTSNEVVYYGAPVCESIYNIAVAIEKSTQYQGYTESQKAFIQSMITGVEQ